jgi:BirA family biotin operon repressor/biotin-[acetyl-CoA-carboxylase] ligase
VHVTLPTELQIAIAHARERLGAFANLRFADSIGSTNDVVMQWAADGAPEGTALLADQQTSGRGRRGHAWSSPAGAGLYLSVVLRGERLTRAPGLATLGAGVAARNAIATAPGLPVALTWPNDLVIGTAWRKLGGILCEASGRDGVVIGIGINVTPASHPPDVAARAASIEGELGRSVDRTSLIVECLAELQQLSEALRDDRGAAVLEAWRAHGAEGWQHAPVRWQDGEQVVHAVARDIDADGALIVERDGQRVRVIAGEVVWERRL